MRSLAPIVLAALPAWAEPVSAPSGQPLDVVEAFWDGTAEAPRILRVRVLAPEIGSERSFSEVEADFLHLCRTVALPRVGDEGPEPTVVINLMDRPIPFGATDPDATQYFEAFRIEGGDCVWQGL